MRVIVIAIATLACAKVWTQDRVYRSIMQDALLQAYEDRAAATCQKEVQRVSRSAQTSFATAADREVVIGNSKTDVAIWDYQNPLWDVRFRHPHVLLTDARTKTHCAFDVAAGLASVGVN